MKSVSITDVFSFLIYIYVSSRWQQMNIHGLIKVVHFMKMEA